MKTTIHRTLLFFVLFSLETGAFAAPGHQWTAASAQDIRYALGPDAEGLELSDDNLPDLFELTSIRLDEDARKFLVEQPYLDGRWRGGKVVIEYARDLSYTLVSIYDKKGRRQRIYSVRVKPKDQKVVEADKAKYAKLVQAAEMGIPLDDVPSDDAIPVVDIDQGPSPARDQMSASTPAPVKESKREKARRRKQEAAEAAEKSKPAQATVATARMAPEPTAGSAVTKPSSVWMPPVTTTKATHSSKKESDAVESAAVEPGAAYEWDEKQGAYVPVKRTGTASASGTDASVAPSKESASSRSRPVKEKVSTEVAPPSTPKSEETKESRRSRRRQKPAQEVPDLVAVDEQTRRPSPTSAVHEKGAAASSSSHGSSVWMPSSEAPAPAASAPAAAKPGAEAVPSTEELLADSPEPTKEVGTASKRSKSRSRESATQEASHAPAARETPVEPVKPPPPPEPPPVPVTTMTPSEKAAMEEAKRAKELEAEAKRHPPKRNVVSKPAAATEAADDTPVSIDSDHWKPTAGKPAPAVEPDIPKVAMIPKTPSREQQFDNMIHAAQDGKAVTAEGDTWSPKKVSLPKADLETQAELARVRAQKKEPVAPKVKVRRDINNPEEGVMPVNEFEKFSGGRYGRHREYERRFYFGKRAKSQVKDKDYDFYIDEVDRKKEIHNVYYYKKGKAPILVAVERHTKVTFLSNYDVDKEDAGKISTY